MEPLYQRALEDVIVVIDAVAIACGSTEGLEEARMLASLLLDKLRKGERVERGAVVSALAKIRDALLEARDELEEEGCLEAYRIDDAIARIDSVIGPPPA